MPHTKKIYSDAKTVLKTVAEMYDEEILLDEKPFMTKKTSKTMPKKSVTPTLAAAVKEPTATLSAGPGEFSALAATIAVCKKCDLCKTRTQTVFGSGNPNADILFIGEAPGADEDEQGLPFVGRAGQLLTKMIEEPRSLGIPRSQVYIANILKCRPPENRKPLPSEIDQCEPYLIKQIGMIRPKIICALGATSANTLLKNNLSITAMREHVYDYHGVPLIVTYHPAALLRNPNWKQPAWDDLLKLKALYEKL